VPIGGPGARCSVAVLTGLRSLRRCQDGPSVVYWPTHSRTRPIGMPTPPHTIATLTPAPAGAHWGPWCSLLGRCTHWPEVAAALSGWPCMAHVALSTGHTSPYGLMGGRAWSVYGARAAVAIASSPWVLTARCSQPIGTELGGAFARWNS